MYYILMLQNFSLLTYPVLTYPVTVQESSSIAKAFLSHRSQDTIVPRCSSMLYPSITIFMST